MSNHDSDVEMLGSPVLPQIKHENDADIEETECIVLAVESNDEVDQMREQTNNEELEEESTHMTDAVGNNVDEDDDGDDDRDRDPMDLLELLESRETTQRDKDVDLDTYNINDEQQTKTSNNKIETEKSKNDRKSIPNIDHFIETMPWLCEDKDHMDRAFCLYCNVSMKKSPSYYSNHESTSTHKEREIDYIEFMDNASEDIMRIRTNKDFDGDIKKEREKIEELYLNYLFDKWSKVHGWIVRTENTFGYLAYCRYCHITINVSLLRSRKAHEDGRRHNEAKRNSRPRRKTISDATSVTDSDCSNGSANGESRNMNSHGGGGDGDTTLFVLPDGGPDDRDAADGNDGGVSSFMEKSKTSADLCRCKLCDITMFTTSFMRHSISNLHKQNLAALDNPAVPDIIEKPQWQAFQKLHPWLIADPNNPMEAYCKYCDKRLAYGTSAAKRLIHEHSAPHKAAVKKANEAEAAAAKSAAAANSKKAAGKSSTEANSENDSSTMPSSGEEDEDEDSTSEQQNDEENANESGDGNESETASKSGNDTETENETSQRRSASGTFVLPPAFRPYHRGGKFVFCRYCKIKMQNLSKTIKNHLKTQRHFEHEEVYKRRSIAVKEGKARKASGVNERFKWLVRFKNNADVVFCKYCSLRFSAKANRYKHETTRRHIEAAKKIAENPNEIPAEPNADELNTASAGASSAQQSTVSNTNAATTTMTRSKPLKVITKPLTKLAVVRKKYTQSQLKSIFEWLQFKKGMRPNYGYCTYCEKPVFIHSPKYGYRHQRLGPHLRARNQRNKAKKDALAAAKTDNQQQHENLKRNQIDSEDAEADDSIPEGPPAKRFKPNSLQTAIQTAKRLTAVHLEMLKFMRDSGHRESKFNDFQNLIEKQRAKLQRQPSSQQQQTSPKTAESAVMDLSATLSPIVYAATNANKRDQFDLFFNSISETIKVLPADLASEAKLKVMQVIFEIETRAQQRQQQPQQQQQQQQQDQTQPPPPAPPIATATAVPMQTDDDNLATTTTPSNSQQATTATNHAASPIHHTTTANGIIDLIPSPEPFVVGTTTPQQQQQPAAKSTPQTAATTAAAAATSADKNNKKQQMLQTALQKELLQAQLQLRELRQSNITAAAATTTPAKKYSNQAATTSALTPTTIAIAKTTAATVTATPSQTGGPKKFLIQATTNNVQQQQQQQPQQNRQQQVATSTPKPVLPRSSVPKSGGGVTVPSPMQVNTIVHGQRKIVPRPQLPPQSQAQTQQQTPQIGCSTGVVGGGGGVGGVVGVAQQSDNLARHRIVTNQLNNLVSNVSQRMSMNNVTVAMTTSTPQQQQQQPNLTISSVNSLSYNNDQNLNNNNANTNNNTNNFRSFTANRPAQIRTVPLSSLTKAKYQSPNSQANMIGVEPQQQQPSTIQQIQLNSSTQSKIITIDANDFHQRR